MVCRELHKLPNDPALRDLTPFQALWVVGNMVRDAEQAEGRDTSSAGAPSRMNEETIVATDLDDAEFAAFSARARAEAVAEAAHLKEGARG